jgi:hypothetical protein
MYNCFSGGHRVLFEVLPDAGDGLFQFGRFERIRQKLAQAKSSIAIKNDSS